MKRGSYRNTVLNIRMPGRLTFGNTTYHEKLEQELSRFMKREAAMLLNLGYAGFSSLIDAIVDRHDVIIYDANVHACLIDGVRMHQGRRYSFRHNDINHLEQQLSKCLKTGKTGSIVVIVDGVYSMLGEQANLKDICKLKDKYSFNLIVDDSHGFGILGPNGRGAPEYQNVEESIDIHLATFTKALGSIGAFVAASKPIIEYLKYNIRSQIFSRAIPIANVAGILKKMEIIQTEPNRRKLLWDNTALFKEGLKRSGYNVGNIDSPITPIFISSSDVAENDQSCISILRELRERYKIFSYAVTYPVVPKGSILIRMVTTTNHTPEQINYTINAFKELYDKYPENLGNSLNKH